MHNAKNREAVLSEVDAPLVFRLSGKNLGALALPESCARCEWLKLRVKKLPYQKFPGIFSSLDAYNKAMVHAWFDRHAAPPPWLARVEPFTGYRAPPHWSRFLIMDRETAIELSGEPDGVLVRADGSLCIVDYKTAKHSGNQDALFPMYATQLNAYRLIAQRLEWPPITRLLLIYMEPTQTRVADDTAQGDGGYEMTFAAHAVEVPIDDALVPRLLRRARELHDLPAAPPARDGCGECAALAKLLTSAAPVAHAERALAREP